MFRDKEQQVTDRFWQLITEQGIEKVSPSPSPAAPDVHAFFTICSTIWDQGRQGPKGATYKTITRYLEWFVKDLREQFRDKVATITVAVNTKPYPYAKKLIIPRFQYVVNLVASLGDQPCPKNRTLEISPCESAASCAAASRR